MFDTSLQRMKVRTVDINSEAYEVGMKYMIRLDKEDFTQQNVARLAKTAKMTVADFKNRFGHLCS
jgi:hypothetical protein